MSNAEIALGFSLSEARIGTVDGGESGLLVWKFGQLVAVLTQLDEEVYSTKGKWFLETGFGLLTGQHRSFNTIEEAVRWVAERTFSDHDCAVDRSAIFAAGR
ncbi:hypothetical protein [Mesorhizobium sp. B1-1-8]|uniref:hypothetical protein n=1 Tax=Mesorhizobium sp. B1-1-8 TaxID=2589976 RepID=UPI001D00D033|nr:hypothetical protein [Mesorhizobium sp. B1-1-8]UCI10468.1 hypothetical protein FJ974_29605 [Mesorhizobium sp. B1-1-8]